MNQFNHDNTNKTNTSRTNILIKKYTSIGNVIFYPYLMNWILFVVMHLNNILIEFEMTNPIYTILPLNELDNFVLNKILFDKETIKIITCTNIIIIFTGIVINFLIGSNILKKNIIEFSSPIWLKFFNDDSGLIKLVEIIFKNILLTLNIMQISIYLLPSLCLYNVFWYLLSNDVNENHNSIYMLLSCVVTMLIIICILLCIISTILYIFELMTPRINYAIDYINNLLKTELTYTDCDDLNLVEKIV